MKLAQVIVDVPAMQTDQPFSYLIPPQLAVEVGMRVEVGFGSRHVQGFVVGFETASEPLPDNLKPIIRALHERDDLCFQSDVLTNHAA